MLELAIIVALFICGSVIGGVLGACSGIPTLTLLSAVVGGFAGTLGAYLILYLVRHARLGGETRDVEPRAVAPSPIGTQVTFRTRMAKYLRLEEAKVLQSDSYKSSMPFWSLVDVYWQRTTRTAQEIQTILLRIRDRLRSSK